MIMLLQILDLQLTLGLPEIIVFVLVAIILGFCIHFFWSSKKNIRIEDAAAEGISENDNWKLKYYNDMDMQERAQQQLRERLAETRENEQILSIEVEELRKEIDDFENRLSSAPVPPAVVETKSPASAGFDYLTQLKSAQEHLVENNNTVSRLVGQIELLKDSESKYSTLLKENEDLTSHLTELKKHLTEKENELNQIRQQQRL